MKNLFSALIFSDTYSSEPIEITKERTLASIPFAGRFRTVDFVLSSLVNADVSNVAVITKRNYASLEDHLGSGAHWDLDHRNSRLRILSPFFKTANNNEAFMARGRLDALRSVQVYIKSIKEDYVVLTGGNLIANIDFESVFSAHLESGADITTVYANTVSTSSLDVIMDMDESGRVNELTYSTGEGACADVSLNIYVLKRDLLVDIIRKADAYDYYNFEKHVLITGAKELNIVGFKHDGYARIIRSVKDYYETSMEMLSREVRGEVFDPSRPVITRPMDTVPVLYEYNAKIENSLIADGCRIDGTVKNSIIFRNVVVETGAVVENCIIMQNCVIGRDSVLKSVVADKNTVISPNKQLVGDEKYPYVLSKGQNI